MGVHHHTVWIRSQCHLQLPEAKQREKLAKRHKAHKNINDLNMRCWQHAKFGMICLSTVLQEEIKCSAWKLKAGNISMFCS